MSTDNTGIPTDGDGGADDGSGRKPIRKRWIFAGVFALVIVGALIAAFLVGEDPDDESDTAQPPGQDTSTPATPPSEGDDSDGVERDIQGAFPDNTQRTWPRKTLDFDDSGWQNPGSYATDRVGRPLWIPNEHDGDMPDEADRTDDPGACTDVELTGDTQQQYTNGRFMAVNETAGPFKTDYGVPWGYAHSPQGAVMAAMNAFSWINPSNRDELGLWAMQMKWEGPLSDEALKSGFDNFRDINTAESPAKFNVKSCSDDVVVVQVATAMQDDSMDADVMEFPMIWKDVPEREGKDWKVVMNAEDEERAALPQQDTSDYTAVNYQ